MSGRYYQDPKEIPSRSYYQDPREIPSRVYSSSSGGGDVSSISVKPDSFEYEGDDEDGDVHYQDDRRSGGKQALPA